MAMSEAQHIQDHGPQHATIQCAQHRRARACGPRRCHFDGAHQRHKMTCHSDHIKIDVAAHVGRQHKTMQPGSMRNKNTAWALKQEPKHLRMRRDRRSGNSHDVLREFVNSIMKNMFMTLPRKGLPSADLASQMSISITRQGFGKCVCTLMGNSTNN